MGSISIENSQCKPGDLVYKVALDGAVIEMKVIGIQTLSGKKSGDYLKVEDVYRKRIFMFPLSQLGKTMFKDKEEAEKLGAERRLKLFGEN